MPIPPMSGEGPLLEISDDRGDADMMQKTLQIGLTILCATAGMCHSANAQGHAAHRTPQQSDSVPDPVGRSFVDPPAPPRDLDLQWTTPRQRIATDRAWTLDELLQHAVGHNPTIRQARLQINASLAQAMQAGLYPNPTVSYQGEQIGIAGTAGEWHGAVVQQRIVTGNKLQLSRNKYLQRAKVAEHLAVAQQFKVCNDIRVHFYHLLASSRLLALERELLKTSEDRLATTREMYNLGQANLADVHRANAMLQRQRLALKMTENHVRQNSLALASLAGLETSQLTVAGTLASDRELIDFDVAYSRVVSESPEIAAAHAKLREDCITVTRERREWIPDVVISGGSGYNFVDRETTAAAGVSVEIPLFDRNQGTIEQAEADWNRQQSEIQRLRLRLQKLLSQEYQSYLTAMQHVMEYEAVVLPESRQAYQLALEGYKANRAEWPDVLEAQRDYTQHRREFVQHQLQRRTSEVLIDGYLLHGGLDAAPGVNPPGHIDSTPNPR